MLLKFSAAMRALALAALALAAPLSAQAVFQQDRNVPNGSPVDPSQQQGNQQGQSQNPYPQSSQRIEPAEIDGDRRSSDRDEDEDEDGDRRSDRSDRRSEFDERLANEDQRFRRPAPPNEFERFVERRVGRRLPRFGAGLLVPATRDFSVPATTTVPATYVLNPGDQVFIGLSGSVEGTVETVIDSSGRIFLPRVGSVRLAGITFGDLKDVIARAVRTQYRGFDVSVSVTRLRGIRVYVTGFANNTGAFSVNSLSTMLNAALAAGGPSAGGSFRSLQLYRNGELVSDFDLYDLVRGGDRSRDAVLQNEDVLYIPPVGEQVAITGSVNEEAVYEAKKGESLADLLRIAGGTNVLADTSRVILYRLADLDTVSGTELASTGLEAAPVSGGDILQVLSQGSLARPLERQAVLVRIDGEVTRPGNYYLPPNSTLQQAVAQAGGYTSRAFVYGANFQRLTVRRQQREAFEEAIRQVELSLAAAPLNASSAIDPATRAQQIASATAVLDRLRTAEPDGRVVLPIAPTANTLPVEFTLENNDALYIPPRPTTVGVFGAVYRPASFLIEGQSPRRVRDYIAQAGGSLRAADKGAIFVVRANGAVLTKSKGALGARVLPGDVIFVPVKTQNTDLLARIAQISSIVLSAALGVATIEAIAD